MQITTWWLTGLPCAGKTTLANALATQLRANGQAVCVLDGDVLRAGLSRDLGFGPADREEQARRVAEMAHLINQNSIHAIVALVSPTRSGRGLARQIIGTPFIEVYLATPLAICRQRDVKGWYAKSEYDAKLALTGVSAPYEVPQSPELSIDTHLTSIENSLTHLLNAIQNNPPHPATDGL